MADGAHHGRGRPGRSNSSSAGRGLMEQARAAGVGGGNNEDEFGGGATPEAWRHQGRGRRRGGEMREVSDEIDGGYMYRDL